MELAKGHPLLTLVPGFYRVPVVEHVRDEQRVEGGDVSAAEGVGQPAAGAGASSPGGQATHLVWGHEREVCRLYVLDNLLPDFDATAKALLRWAGINGAFGGRLIVT